MKKFTDTELLDYLQQKTDECNYTGKVICRWSITGRGWRLHETSGYKQIANTDVRQAITDFIEFDN